MNKLIASRIYTALGVSPGTRLALHEPSFKGTDALAYVTDCVSSGWVSSAGSLVNTFEKQLTDFTGAQFCVAVNNGTSALRLALHLVGVKPGDEVLLPSLTFVATANAISHLGAIPHFVDITTTDYGICPLLLDDYLSRTAWHRDSILINRSTGRPIKALVPVHVFGTPASIEQLHNLCTKWGLRMIEDAAEALGSLSGSTHCGLTGDVGCLSFNGNKLITTGGGGAIITNNSDIAQQARHLSSTAKLPHDWEFFHDQLAWNDRMPSINAALGVAQMEQIHSLLKHKRNIHKLYADSFVDVPGVSLLEEPKGTVSNYWLNTLILADPCTQTCIDKRDSLLTYAHNLGIQMRPAWTPLHLLPMYVNHPRSSLVNTVDAYTRLINIPSSPSLLQPG